MSFLISQEIIWQTKEKKKILIAAHKGTFGGHIVPNTIPAYENAIKQGADIIEVDVVMNTDGDFYTFHDGQEKTVLGVNKNIRTMSTKEINGINCLNHAGALTKQKVEKLDNVLEHFKGRCLINIDRSWFYWNETIKLLDRHSMEDQIILKSPADAKYLKALQDSGSQLMYMPIVNTKEQVDLVMKYALNLIGVEILFKDLQSPLIKKEFMEQMNSQKILKWVNAIVVNEKTSLCGELDDNRAIMESEDSTWGELIGMGFDIIQTDWPLLLRQYVNEKFKIN